jgi:hypothetical protein
VRPCVARGLLLQRIDAPAPPQRGLAPSPHRLRQGTPAHLSRRPSPPHAALPLIHPHTHTHTRARTLETPRAARNRSRLIPARCAVADLGGGQHERRGKEEAPAEALASGCAVGPPDRPRSRSRGLRAEPDSGPRPLLGLRRPQSSEIVSPLAIGPSLSEWIATYYCTHTSHLLLHAHERCTRAGSHKHASNAGMYAAAVPMVGLQLLRQRLALRRVEPCSVFRDQAATDGDDGAEMELGRCQGTRRLARRA